MTATFYVGDAVTVMNTLPEKSVDLILTSPPFLALRSYLPQDHPDKALEGGSQATPGAYIDWLLDVVEACARVLAPHGSLCFELGDTYSGSSASGGDWSNPDHPDGGPHVRGIYEPPRRDTGTGWPLAKSLSLIPETFRFAMVYGVNPHTRRKTEPWRLRNVIRWVRPNPPVGALGDKFRPATSELMVFCKAKDRFFDLDAVRTPHQSDPTKFTGNGYEKGRPEGFGYSISEPGNPAGAPPLDWWNIPPGGYPGAHYAVWPPELLVKPIRAMCPEKVCRRCGEASRRIVSNRFNFDRHPALAAHIRERREALGISIQEVNNWFGYVAGANWWESLTPSTARVPNPDDYTKLKIRLSLSDDFDDFVFGDRRWTESEIEYSNEAGRGFEGDRAMGRGGHQGMPRADRFAPDRFSDCGHDNYRPGLVLDPFAGSGTTLSVATGHGRDAIGIDLDERNYELALDRVGPLVLTSADGTAPRP